MEHILEKIAADCGLKRKNNRWEGPCPECGGKKDSGRFHLRDDGGYKCWACDFKGDLITWLRTREGMSCPEAFDAIGRPCNRPSCPAWGNCRHGDGSGRRNRYHPAKITAPAAAHQKLAEADSTPPADRWLSWAENLLAEAEQALPANREALAYLAARGIDQAAASRFRLGWRSQTENVDRASIGLPPEKAGKTTLWTPPGLVIPIFDKSGRLHRLRIRRPPADRARFAKGLKYVWMEGSGKAPLAIYPPAETRGGVIVEAELDAFAVAAVNPDVLVVAVGTVKGGLDKQLRAALSSCPVILVALDAEPEKNGKPGPGPAAVKAWLANYRQAKYWPVPEGKDPGDYAQTGGDLRVWIEAGLPPARYEQASTCLIKQQGGSGDGNIPSPGEEPPEYYRMTLPDGSEVLLTDDQATWERLAAGGEIVFTRRELQRLKTAQQELTADERAILLARVLDAKKTFKTAYVYRGGGFR